MKISALTFVLVISVALCYSFQGGKTAQQKQCMLYYSTFLLQCMIIIVHGLIIAIVIIIMPPNAVLDYVIIPKYIINSVAQTQALYAIWLRILKIIQYNIIIIIPLKHALNLVHCFGHLMHPCS